MRLGTGKADCGHKGRECRTSVLMRVLPLLFLTACIAIFCGAGDADRAGPALRKTATSLYRLPGREDMPAQIENRGAGGRMWAMRAPVSQDLRLPAFGNACQFILGAQAMALAVLEPERSQPRLMLAPLLAYDDATPPQLFNATGPEQGDIMDSAGRPLRWLVPRHVAAGYSIPRPNPFSAVPVNEKFERALARLAPSAGARAYRGLVENYARRYNLNVDLVMAIIHSESNFAPSLVSSKSAMGLMQLLPSTASGEVHRFLYGKRGQISFAELSQPDINIRYGTAYLHILHTRYFQNVRDGQVREACVIASYNMGPNGFLRLYGPNPEAAVARINSMSREEFHADLPSRLPVRETRYYVEKVRRMKAHYAGNGGE